MMEDTLQHASWEPSHHPYQADITIVPFCRWKGREVKPLSNNRVQAHAYSFSSHTVKHHASPALGHHSTVGVTPLPCNHFCQGRPPFWIGRPSRTKAGAFLTVHHNARHTVGLNNWGLSKPSTSQTIKPSIDARYSNLKYTGLWGPLPLAT